METFDLLPLDALWRTLRTIGTGDELRGRTAAMAPPADVARHMWLAQFVT